MALIHGPTTPTSPHHLPIIPSDPRPLHAPRHTVHLVPFPIDHTQSLTLSKPPPPRFVLGAYGRRGGEGEGGEDVGAPEGDAKAC